MARIYDVVCRECGEIMSWCKYDAPFETCENCGSKLTTSDKDLALEIGAYESGYDGWNPYKVRVFGVGTSSFEVHEFSQRIKAFKRRRR